MSNRLNQEREKELEPKRYQYAKNKLAELGIELTYEHDQYIQFIWNGNKITHYNYTGWHTGKGIKDGRGIENLLKQLV
jgi:hypothetical protein